MKNDMTCIFTAILDTDKNFPGIFFYSYLSVSITNVSKDW